MSKTTLLDLVKTPKSELQKMKVGVLVRSTLPELLSTHLLSEREVVQLQELDYSKQVFGMNYPILKKLDLTFSINTNRTVGDYTRYYAFVVLYKDEYYLITSEWYERNLTPYIDWMKRKVKPV